MDLQKKVNKTKIKIHEMFGEFINSQQIFFEG